MIEDIIRITLCALCIIIPVLFVFLGLFITVGPFFIAGCLMSWDILKDFIKNCMYGKSKH